jgi:hypothetical protein
MTRVNTNVSVGQVLLALSIIALLPSFATADTQVKLQSLTDNLRITEGYKGSVEQWQEARSANNELSHLVIVTNTDHHADVWVDDVGTSLFSDQDHDGYFGGFSLSFDVDTAWGDADVYATIYLQLGTGPTEKFHTTNIFTVYSRSNADVYRVEAELVDNYRAGAYNVQINIHDAHNGDILDSVDAASFRNLRNLPLEAEPYGQSVRATIITEYTGLGGPIFLVLLALAAVIRCRNSGGCIISQSESARVYYSEDHYEQLPDSPPTSHRLPF